MTDARKGMGVGIVVLVAAYVLSQFYRAFLAVLTEALEADIGATAADLSFASGVWFIVFAAAQIPVGWALDRFGPRYLAAGLLLVGGGGGAAVFAMATAPGHITLAMALIGLGCSPVLMASYFILARVYPAAVFATMAGIILGIGSLGNIAGSVPLVWAVSAFGWRGTVFGLAALTALVALLIWAVVRDPPRAVAAVPGSLLNLLRMPALWLILPLMFVNYAPAAGIRGLWIGPYAGDVFMADDVLVGRVTLIMALAMVLGNFAYGPLDRLLGTRKWVIFCGNLLGALACAALWANPAPGLWSAVALLAAVGFFGASFPMIMAHGRAFFPDHLAGRGVTLMNLFGIGGVGVMQVVSGRVYGSGAQAGGVAAGYGTLFGFYALLLAAGLAVYLFSRDRTD